MTRDAVGITPILKWVGGKAWVSERVRARLPARIEGAYREPFAGGAAVFFSLCPEQLPLFDEPARQHVVGQRAHLCDLSADLVEYYESVRDDVEGVIHHVSCMKDEYLSIPDQAGRRIFYENSRALFNDGGEARSRRAARYLFINKTGFNGLMRYNRHGCLNTSHGKYRNPTIFTPEGLRAASRALRGVRLLCADFEVALDGARPGDAVYLDPPHATRSKTSRFTSYTAERWTEEDDERVAAAFWRLARAGVRVVMSQADTPRSRELLRGAEIEVVMRPGTVSSKGDGRGEVAEILASAGPL